MKPYKKALTEFGTREYAGEDDNQEVLKYFNELGFDGKALKDETAWCSAMVNWCAKTEGYEYSAKLNARSWLDFGEVIEEKDRKLGDLVIFWRVSEDDWRGHVGFFINEQDGWINCLGGNQGNELNIKPYAKRRVLGYRRLRKLNVL